MSEQPDNPLERLSGESAQAHEAFTLYVNMGADRSTAKVAQRLSKSKTLINRWSGHHKWQERVRAYDAMLAYAAAQQATERYLADLEEHRDRYRQTGRELHAVARSLLGRVATAMQQNELPLNGATLNTLVRCFQASVNLEAHSLSLDRLLPMLDANLPETTDEHSEQSHPPRL